jgi:hypothetical protein
MSFLTTLLSTCGKGCFSKPIRTINMAIIICIIATIVM